MTKKQRRADIIKNLTQTIESESAKPNGNMELVAKLDKKLKRNKGESLNLMKYIEDRLGHDKRYAIDSSKIKNELGWVPKYSFNKGIDKTIDWYLNNLY